MVIQDLKILVVGIGSIGRRHSDVLYSNIGCRKITLWDPNRKNAEEHAKKFPGMQVADDYAAALKEGFDVVFICSPPALHMEQAEAAILAGSHVMIEKPLALDMKSLGRVMELAKEHKKFVSVALCNRYHKGMQRLKEIVDSKKIGKIINIRSTM